MYLFQFQRYFIPQVELEESFIYIIHKPIDFSIEFSYTIPDKNNENFLENRIFSFK